MTKSKKKAYIVVALVAALALAGTLAYWFSTSSIDNPFETKAYGGTTVEKFTPEKDWQPGEKVDKQVKATNTGDYDIIVRVKFDEKWMRDNSQIATANSSQNGFFPTKVESGDPVKVTYPKTDVSSVYKEILNAGTDGKWELKSDGYYYYKEILKPGDQTLELLNSVILCTNADMGTYADTMTYALVDATATTEPADTEYKSFADIKALCPGTPDSATTVADLKIPDGKVLYSKNTVDIDSANKGLANAKYTLKVTTDFCQACKEAAQENNWLGSIVSSLPAAAAQ